MLLTLFTKLKYFGALAALLCACLLTLISCRPSQTKEWYFGMDIRELNPLVMVAVNGQTGETVFSRDPSIISEVSQLFDKFKMTPEQSSASDRQGITFTVSTMYGDFCYGTCSGNWMRRNGKDYTLDDDYTTDISLLYERIKSETDNTTEVSKDTILSLKADMTYAQLLELFGDSLETAVVGEEKAVLYQYAGRPFYIRFLKDTDMLGFAGEDLLKQIWSNYNLSSLTTPEPQDGGRLAVYEQAFVLMIDTYRQSDVHAMDELVLNTACLPHLTEQERTQLVKYLADRYQVTVTDSALATMYANGDGTEGFRDGRWVVWVEHYDFVGNSRMILEAACRRDGQPVESKTMTWTYSDGQWKR